MSRQIAEKIDRGPQQMPRQRGYFFISNAPVRGAKAAGDSKAVLRIAFGCATGIMVGSIPMLYAFTWRRRAPLAALALLVVAGIAAGAWYATAPLRPVTESNESVLDIQAEPVANIEGVTDQGAVVPLFRIRFLTPVAEVQQFVRDLEAQQFDVQRVQDLGPECNCHGWVFTGGQFSLRDFEVQAILNDNGYTAVERPSAGDVIVYWNEHGITHSGVVCQADESGQVLVESKWGPFGVYRHAPEDQPYSSTFRYFHAERGTHLLKFHWQLRRTQTAR